MDIFLVKFIQIDLLNAYISVRDWEHVSGVVFARANLVSPAVAVKVAFLVLVIFFVVVIVDM